MASEQVIRPTDAAPIPVAQLSGDIDLANAADWFAAVKASIDGAEVVVVDLTDVTFIDSTALREVMLLSRACAVRLVAVGQPRRLLKISGLDQVFPVFDKVSDAQAGR